MKKAIVFVSSLALVVAVGTGVSAQARKGQPKAAAGAPETVVYDAASAMAFLTTTAGEWGGAASKSEHGNSRGGVTVKTKAAGSAVVHHYAQGTPGEMETAPRRCEPAPGRQVKSGSASSARFTLPDEPRNL